LPEEVHRRFLAFADGDVRVVRFAFVEGTQHVALSGKASLSPRI
jgi:hypothetical protein